MSTQGRVGIVRYTFQVGQSESSVIELNGRVLAGISKGNLSPIPGGKIKLRNVISGIEGTVINEDGTIYELLPSGGQGMYIPIRPDIGLGLADIKIYFDSSVSGNPLTLFLHVESY